MLVDLRPRFLLTLASTCLWDLLFPFYCAGFEVWEWQGGMSESNWHWLWARSSTQQYNLQGCAEDAANGEYLSCPCWSTLALLSLFANLSRQDFFWIACGIWLAFQSKRAKQSSFVASKSLPFNLRWQHLLGRRANHITVGIPQIQERLQGLPCSLARCLCQWPTIHQVHAVSLFLCTYLQISKSIELKEICAHHRQALFSSERFKSARVFGRGTMAFPSLPYIEASPSVCQIVFSKLFLVSV